MNKNLIYASVFLLGIIAVSYFFPVEKEQKTDKFTALSTTVVIDWVVKEIVGDHMNTLVLIEGEADPHSYEMRKGDREKIFAADVIFANGLSLEHSPSLFYHLQQEQTVFLGDLLLAKHPEWIISNQGETDPHLWMDLFLMQKVASMICDKVCMIDPAHKKIYQERCRELQGRMQELDQKIHGMMHEIPEENRYLVSSHDAFMYFLRRYFPLTPGDRLFSMQGVSTESEISLKRIRQVVDYIKKHQIHTIFYESNLPKDCIMKVLEICSSAGMEVEISKEPLYGDTLGGMTYLEMVEHDARVITGSLRRKK